MGPFKKKSTHRGAGLVSMHLISPSNKGIEFLLYHPLCHFSS